MEALHRDGSLLRVVLEVSDAEKKQPGNPAYAARVILTTEEPSALPAVVADYERDVASGQRGPVGSAKDSVQGSVQGSAKGSARGGSAKAGSTKAGSAKASSAVGSSAKGSVKSAAEAVKADAAPPRQLPRSAAQGPGSAAGGRSNASISPNVDSGRLSAQSAQTDVTSLAAAGTAPGFVPAGGPVTEAAGDAPWLGRDNGDGFLPTGLSPPPPPVRGVPPSFQMPALAQPPGSLRPPPGWPEGMPFPPRSFDDLLRAPAPPPSVGGGSNAGGHRESGGSVRREPAALPPRQPRRQPAGEPAWSDPVAPPALLERASLELRAGAGYANPPFQNLMAGLPATHAELPTHYPAEAPTPRHGGGGVFWGHEGGLLQNPTFEAPAEESERGGSGAWQQVDGFENPFMLPRVAADKPSPQLVPPSVPPPPPPPPQLVRSASRNVKISDMNAVINGRQRSSESPPAGNGYTYPESMAESQVRILRVNFASLFRPLLIARTGCHSQWRPRMSVADMSVGDGGGAASVSDGAGDEERPRYHVQRKNRCKTRSHAGRPPLPA